MDNIEQKIKVLLVDDHVLFRKGVAAVLAGNETMEIVGEASDGLEAIEKVKQLNPTMVVMDLDMPRCTGVQASQLLQVESPQTNILVVTVSERETDLFAAIKAGAKGYLLKDASPEELIQAVIHIAGGGVIVSASMASKLLAEFKIESQPLAEASQPEDESGLSQREIDVLKLLTKGSSNKEIANDLCISENTVKTHLRNIMSKLQLANRSQAVAYALRAKLDCTK